MARFPAERLRETPPDQGAQQLLLLYRLFLVLQTDGHIRARPQSDNLEGFFTELECLFHNRVMQIEIPVDSTSTRKSRPPPRFASVSARSSVKTETDRPSSLPARRETSNSPSSSIHSIVMLIRCRGCTIGPYHFKSIMCGFCYNIHKG